jgi:hypothetical protein
MQLLARSAIVPDWRRSTLGCGQKGGGSVSALSDLRVLELSSGVAAEYCGKLLADFGARVIKAEPHPASGGRTRAHGAVRGGRRAPREQRLCSPISTPTSNPRPWIPASRRRTSRPCALSVRSESTSSSTIIPRAGSQALGIDPANCAAQHPALIVCSITPFGYEAPAIAAHRPQRERVSTAAGDITTPSPGGSGHEAAAHRRRPLSAGLRVRASVRRSPSSPQPCTGGRSSGRGQFIDVSQQASMATLGRLRPRPDGGRAPWKSAPRRQAYDLGGPATFFQCQRRVRLPMAVRAWDTGTGMWTLDGRARSGCGTIPSAGSSCISRQGAHRSLPRRDRALDEGPATSPRSRSRAQKLGVPLVPVNTMEDVFHSSQMQFRRFFTQVEHPTLGTHCTYPTVPYRLGATPARDRTNPRRSSGSIPIEALREASQCIAAREIAPPLQGAVIAMHAPRGIGDAAPSRRRGPAAGRARSGSDQGLGRPLHR